MKRLGKANVEMYKTQMMKKTQMIKAKTQMVKF